MLGKSTERDAMSGFETLVPVAEEVFFKRNDPNDPRLGEIIPRISYDEASIVIIGCPQDEGVRRNSGRVGAADAPTEIRRQFYKLTPFGISQKVTDIGDIDCSGPLEEIHERLTASVTQILRDGKKAVVLGGGNDISYADCRAMAEVFGPENWLGVNVDAHFDVRDDADRNSGTPYRQLLEEKLISPEYFFEAGYQPQLASPIYFKYLNDLGVNLLSLDELRSSAADGLRFKMREQFIHHSQSLSAFFGFDIDAVNSSDAPGSSAPSPMGLRAGEFLNLVKFAASLSNTKIIEFTEVNPIYDIDDRTSKLVALAIHQFCANSAR
jgi:formiminoglutamase